MVTQEISNIADKASLVITISNNKLEIKQKLRFKDKSIWGVLFFFFGGLLFTILPFIKTSSTITKVLGVLIGVSLLTMSIITLIRQVADYIKFTEQEIIFRYNLKQTTLPIEMGMKTKMKSELMKISRPGTMGSDIISVTHYLQTSDKEFPVLTFQMDNSNAKEAIELGKSIVKMMNNKLGQENELKNVGNVSE